MSSSFPLAQCVHHQSSNSHEPLEFLKNGLRLLISRLQEREKLPVGVFDGGFGLVPLFANRLKCGDG